MNIVAIFVGLVLLVFGRKLFWLLGGAIGFAAGMSITNRFLHNIPEPTLLILALSLGLLGAILAYFLQKVGVRIAGFLVGGFFLMTVLERFGLDSAPWPWLVFIIGGIIGLVIVAKLFDWALIILSSIAGAAFVVQGLDVAKLLDALLILILSTAGIVIQTRLKRKTPPAEPKKLETPVRS
jgi:uncharacterized membrane protein YsdA (DUF1294 family)